MIYHTCINVFGTCYSAPNICSSLPGGGTIGPSVRIMITKRKIAYAPGKQQVRLPADFLTDVHRRPWSGFLVRQRLVHKQPQAARAL